MVKLTPEPVESDYITILPEILDQKSNLDITSDLMFVNKIPFIITLGQLMKFTTIENVPNYWAPTLLKRIQSVIRLYNKQKYSIPTMFTYNKFEVL